MSGKFVTGQSLVSTKATSRTGKEGCNSRRLFHTTSRKRGQFPGSWPSCMAASPLERSRRCSIVLGVVHMLLRLHTQGCSLKSEHSVGSTSSGMGKTHKHQCRIFFAPVNSDQDGPRAGKEHVSVLKFGHRRRNACFTDKLRGCRGRQQTTGGKFCLCLSNHSLPECRGFHCQLRPPSHAEVCPHPEPSKSCNNHTVHSAVSAPLACTSVLALNWSLSLFLSLCLLVHRLDTVALLHTCFPCLQTSQTHLTISIPSPLQTNEEEHNKT